MKSRSHVANLSLAAEAAIVALACKGDSLAFAELVRRRQSAIRNLMRRLCRDPALADDLAQEVFLRAWQRLGQLQSVAAFGGWLRQIGVNAWLQHLRSAKRFVDLDDGLDEPATMPNSATHLDLDSALAQLSAPARLCVVLNYYEGLSHADIAALARLPLGTVKSHITRGTARLRELLAAYQLSNEQRI